MSRQYEFYNKNYETWSNSMKRIAKETNTIFWDTTFFNRQSFSCYFFLREDDKSKLNNRAKILIMMSCLDNIYFIDEETNIVNDLVDLLNLEMNKLYPTYIKASEEELMVSLKPYFECFKNVDFMDFTIYNAFLGYKPSL